MPQEMTPELRQEIAEKKRQTELEAEHEKLQRARLAARLDLLPEYDPGLKNTDRANAQRFIDLHKEAALYCAELSERYSNKSWFIWDGQRWARDYTGEIYLLGDKVRGSVDQRVLDEPDEEKRSQLRKIAASLENRGKISGMLEMAAPFLSARLSDFDQDEWLLNVENGTIDLRTGELKRQDPNQFITKLAPVTYDPSAIAPRWEAFLDRIFEGNANLIHFIQKAMGYSLTGSIREQVVFFLYGTGRNGKSTLLDTIKEMMGDYATHTRTETLMARRGGGVPNDEARLDGARLVTATETEDGKRLSEPFIKQISGGEAITARYMRAEFFEFKPQFKLFFGTNHKPAIRGTDYAIWRRIRLVPFDVTITDEECDPDLTKKLLEELPGILNWAITGCLMWQNEGLGLPDEVAAAVEAYRTEQDVLGGFFDDVCIINPLAKVPKGVLYEAYCEWCDENGEKAISQRKMGTRMTERGFTESRTERTRFWNGIGLQTGTKLEFEGENKDKRKMVEIPL
jgi:putative DNA primase/helicase